MSAEDPETSRETRHRQEPLDNRATIEAAVHQNRKRIVAYCRNFFQNEADAEDAAQDVAARAWEKKDTYRGEGKIEGWLKSIATTVCLNNLRKKRAARKRELSWEDPQNIAVIAKYESSSDIREEIDNTLFSSQLIDRFLAKSLDRKRPLEPLDIAIFHLRIAKNWKFPQIAAHLGQPEGTVKDRYNRRIKPIFEEIHSEMKAEMEKIARSAP
jgi:RNA polymerase sigma factor (sigma-70 family)